MLYYLFEYLDKVFDLPGAGVVAQHFIQGVEHLQLNLASGHFFVQLVHQDGLSLELVPAVHPSSATMPPRP